MIRNMFSCKLLAVALLTVLLQSDAITAHFELEVDVVGFHDPVNDCGGGFDICNLYIYKICLGHQVEESESCSLNRDTQQLDLDHLPATRTFTSKPQPWPVDFQLYLDIKDNDLFTSDDDIDDIVIRTSLNTSSEFTAVTEFSGERISLSLRFRIRCTDGYKGPHCDCLPHNNCQCLEGSNCTTPTTTHTTTPTTTHTTTPTTTPTTPSTIPDECNCENRDSCITTTAMSSAVYTSPGGGVTSTPAVPTQSTDDGAIHVSVGVAGAVIALIAAAVIVISVTVCLRKRNSKHVNVTTYQSSSGQVIMKTNEAYAETRASDFNYTDDMYAATQPTTASNAAYNVHTSTDVMYDLPSSSGKDIPTATNEAYDVTRKARSGCTYTLNQAYSMS